MNTRDQINCKTGTIKLRDGAINPIQYASLLFLIQWNKRESMIAAKETIKSPLGT